MARGSAPIKKNGFVAYPQSSDFYHVITSTLYAALVQARRFFLPLN